MAPRPIWQGHLRLSLVTCPVSLHSAVSAAGDISFHLLNPETHNRIRMVPTDPDTGPVERSSLVRGYEFEKNRYVVLSEEEINSAHIEASRLIDIERFVDEDEIDRLYWKDPYYLVPDGKQAIEAYDVIREAMTQERRVALGRVVLHTRERLMALEPMDKGITAFSLRTYDEVRRPEDYFEDIPAKRPDPKLIEIASKIIEQLEGPFEPTTFRDRYEDALRDLIKAKLKGKKLAITAPEPEDTSPRDLMELLRKSLERGSAPQPRRAPQRRSPAKPREAAAPARRRSRR
jgi:DNA end-binding protein Ku